MNMSECISHLLSRPAKVELLALIGWSTLHDVIRIAPSTEWRYLAALAEEHFGYFCYGLEPLKDVTEEAYRLALDNAELDKFVVGLLKGGEELYIPGVVPSSELIPTIIQAFKHYSPALGDLRPLNIRFPHARLSLYEIWPDAAERCIRPCPFCVPNVEHNIASFPVPHITDRYHIRNSDSGQQLTIELSQCCHRPDDAYGEPVEYWTRISNSASAIRVLVENNVRCHPELPKGPNRKISLPRQEDLLLEVLGFASRDDLDAAQLTCKFWRDFVTDTAGTLALRPLQHVLICSDDVIIERAPVSDAMPGALFDAMWEQISGYRREEFRLGRRPHRHGPAKARLCPGPESESQSMHLFCPVSQLLADGGRTFRAKSVILRCFNQHEITISLCLMAEIDAKDFDLRAFIEGAAPLIFANEVLLNAERFHLRIGYDDSSPMTASALSDIQEHCHRYLRKAGGCHVSFLQFDSYALFSCDDIVERFLAAARSDDFTMPLSIQMQFMYTPPGIPKPTNCKYPALRDVAISHKVLTRFHGDDALKFDVYHLRNERTDEWLTVCLGKDLEGTIGYVFLKKGRIMTSLEDIAKMKPFPYQLNG
ncbi:hypothetical protein AAVH_12959 [Aphelenchoides avenae]|nr:hypothetical protein AAVH_12959 [Aphelenchus avenae]